MVDYQLIADERKYMFSRVLSLIGAILILVSSVITIAVAYNAYQRLLNDYEESLVQH